MKTRQAGGRASLAKSLVAIGFCSAVVAGQYVSRLSSREVRELSQVVSQAKQGGVVLGPIVYESPGVHGNGEPKGNGNG